MFDSLDDQIKHDLQKQSSGKERMLVYAAIAVTSVLVFGGLFFGTYLFS